MTTTVKKKKQINYHRSIDIFIYDIFARATPDILQQHNEYVFKYHKITALRLKTPYHESEAYNMFIKLINLNTKQGLKQKSRALFCGVLGYLHKQFETFDQTLHSEHPLYTTFFNFSRTFAQEFYKPDFFVKYVYLYFELLFIIKRVKPKKKKKKKVQQKMLVSYLSTKTRANVTIRIINAYLNSFSTHNSTLRVGDALLYLLLSGKNSFLYKKKLSMYNKLLEKKKFY